jgi:hypothetical protein
MIVRLALALTTAASVVAGGAAIGSLILGLRRTQWPPLSRVRNVSLVGCTAMLGLSFALRISGWALALDALGLIAALQACALGFTRRRQLRDYAAMKARGGTDEPPWWPEFEAALSDHIGPTAPEARSRQRDD